MVFYSNYTISDLRPRSKKNQIKFVFFAHLIVSLQQNFKHRSPQLTDQADWIDGEVIDVEHNPFMGLVISIKDKLGRIFFGQSRFFVAL